MFDIGAVTVWFFILEILGFVTFPLTFEISKNLNDKGYALSKAISILLLTYITWAIVSVSRGAIPYGVFTILASLCVLLLISFYLFRKNKSEILAFLQKNKRLIFTYEMIFLFAFLFFTSVRYYDNSILDAEKYQDFMILNGLLRTEKFPLNDPWFTGYPLQYYYFGYLMITTLTKISFIDPGITFNLALATLFSLTLLLSFSVLYNLTKKPRYGFLGLLLVGIVGNFRAIIQIVLEEKILPFNYWPSAHWIIPGTINEFPYWTFLHADLHPHVIAIPFTIAAILLVFNFFSSKSKGFNIFGNYSHEKILTFFVFSISIGALSFMNSWDFPTYLVLSMFAILLQQYLLFEKKKKINLFIRTLLPHIFVLLIASFILKFQAYVVFAILSIIVQQFWTLRKSKKYYTIFRNILPVIVMLILTSLVLNFQTHIDLKIYTISIIFDVIFDFRAYVILTICAVSLQQFFTSKQKKEVYAFVKNISPVFFTIASGFILFLPYYLSFSPSRPIGLVKDRTELQYFLIIYALFFYILLTFLLFIIDKKKFRITGFSIVDAILAITFFGVAALVFFSYGSFATVFLLVIFILLTIFVLFSSLLKIKDNSFIFALILALFAFSLALAIEFFFIDDAFTGDLDRVNTMFKVGMQIWILIALASAYALFYLRENLMKNLNFAKYLWLTILVILVSLSLLFPLLATPTKTENNFEFFGKVATLNGKEYLKQMKFCDYEAIEWLNKNVKGTPIILEAPGDSFKWESCVSANTGLPTLLGWEGHERQWRPNQLPEISQRKSDVDKIYSYTSYSKTGEISIPDSWQAFNWEGDALLTRNEPGTTQEQTAIKISSQNGANANFWQKIVLNGGQEYMLTLWVKTSGIEKVGAIDKIGQVHVREDLDDSSGNIIAESVPLLGDNYWTKAEITFYIPEGKNSIWLSCVLGNWGKAKGEIWFDDFSLYKVNKTLEEEKTNVEDILPIIRKYNIQYIYVGNLEREKYPLQSLEKFGEISDLVYNTRETKIYKIKNGI